MSPECFLHPSVGFISGFEPPGSQSAQERHKERFQVSNHRWFVTCQEYLGKNDGASNPREGKSIFWLGNGK